MVYIIKSVNGIESDIDSICKIMINTEQNKQIFNNDGTYNVSKQVPFNCYTHKDIEFNITVSIGVIVIYSSYEVSNQVLDEKLNKSLLKLDHNYRIKAPLITTFGSSTHHTLITTVSTPNNKSYRNI